MKIYYTHDIFSSQPHGGISRYFSEMIPHLPRDKAAIEIMAGLHINEYLSGRSLGAVPVRGLRVPPLGHTRFLRHALNRRFQRLTMDLKPSTIVHETYPFHIENWTPAKRVVTVHDMVHELFPADFAPGDSTSSIKRSQCEQADQIIAVSESTKQDLIRIFGIDSGKITVIGHGVPSFCAFASQTTQSPPRLKPYLLYVGARHGYKNFSALLSAYASSEKIYREFDLVCFGGGEFSSSEKDAISRTEASGHIHHVQGGDGDLLLLYRDARALVYPSKYEGFGIPPLEAMKLGCPVFCQRTSSLPEVVGDAAIFFKDSSEDAIRSAFEQFLFDDASLRKVSELGRTRSLQFSWQEAACRTFSVYEACLA